MRRTFTIGIWVFPVALTTAVATWAEPPTAVPVVRDQLVVTASQVEERESELPVSIEVIGAEELDARQATSLGEALSTATGLHVVRSGSPGKVTSLFSRGTESDHTLVLWNGIELNNPYFGGFDWAFLPTDGVGRLEIVRGPFSALYGSDALGGAVQVVRARRSGGAVRLEVGENGYGRGAVSAGAAVGGGRLDVAASVRQGDGETANDFYRGGDVVATGEWSVGRSGTIGFLGRVNDSEVGIPFASGLASPRRRVDWREHQLALPYEVTVGSWRVEAQLSSVRLESSFTDPEDLFGFTESNTRSRADRIRAQASYRFGESRSGVASPADTGSGHWLAFGFEGERLEVDDRSVFGVNLEGARQETTSLFAQSLLRLGGARLDLGARLDDSDVYGGRLTPRLGLLVPVGERFSLRASYGEGFRAPSLGELFFPFSGNRELEPETSESYELGFQARGGNWRFDLAGFENRLDNLIDFDFATFTNVNVGRATTRGLEASARYQAGRLSLRANAGSLRATDEISGLPLLRRPEIRAALVASIELGDSLLTATGTYVGERSDVDPVSFERAVNPEYLRVDLAGEWGGLDRVRPYARLENLLDENYQEALGFPAPGRSLIGGVSFGWE